MSETAERTPPIGVLVMAYGGPESLDEVEEFLLDVRGGRPTPPELVAEVAERYAAIGGGSPLNAATSAQAAALAERLAERFGAGRYRVAIGMRHWRPRIAAAVGELAAAGVRRIVGLPLAVHDSGVSVGAYHRALEAAVAELEPPVEVAAVRGFSRRERFLEAAADAVAAGLDRFAPAERARVPVVFTAHSLPERYMAPGDPYPDRFAESAAAVAERTGIRRWRTAYQSAGAVAGRWLGPPLEEVLDELAAAGEEAVLVSPLGFVSDHVEVLFDLDIEARGHATAAGLRFERAPTLGTTPAFVDALADAVAEAARAAAAVSAPRG